jgi:hypothetical protein
MGSRESSKENKCGRKTESQKMEKDTAYELKKPFKKTLLRLKNRAQRKTPFSRGRNP